MNFLGAYLYFLGEKPSGHFWHFGGGGECCQKINKQKNKPL